jgi:hypothetical protein
VADLALAIVRMDARQRVALAVSYRVPRPPKPLNGPEREGLTVQPIAPDDLDSVSHWYFAVVGLQTQQEVFELGRAVHLQRLRSFPTDVELALSLNSLSVAGTMAHYGDVRVQHELIIDAEYIDDARWIPATAAAILAGLRIRTGAEVLCPAVCDRSWAALSGVTGNRCKAYRVEQALLTHAFGDSALVTREDLDWVRDNLARLTELTDDERFRTGVEALCSYLHAANYRMMAAQLWAGLEALFGIRFEIGYRLAVQIALLLEPRGPACRALYEQMRKLYKDRSDAIHGNKMDEARLARHVAEARGILARVLRRILERGKVPSDNDFEEVIFT